MLSSPLIIVENQLSSSVSLLNNQQLAENHF